MTVELTQSRAGHRPTRTADGKTQYIEFAQHSGEVIDVPDDEGRRMIDRGYAKPAKPGAKGN